MRHTKMTKLFKAELRTHASQLAESYWETYRNGNTSIFIMNLYGISIEDELFSKAERYLMKWIKDKI